MGLMTRTDPFCPGVSIQLWTIDPEDDRVRMETDRHPQQDGSLVGRSVEDSVVFEVDGTGQFVGHFCSITFNGIPIIENLLDRWRRTFKVGGDGNTDPNKREMSDEDSFPRLLTGFLAPFDITQKATYTFSPMPAAGLPNVAYTQPVFHMPAMDIYTDDDLAHWLLSTQGMGQRCIRLILHRQNAQDFLKKKPPIPNSPILNPRQLNPAPNYLVWTNLEDYKLDANPCLPFSHSVADGKTNADGDSDEETD